MIWFFLHFKYNSYSMANMFFHNKWNMQIGFFLPFDNWNMQLVIIWNTFIKILDICSIYAYIKTCTYFEVWSFAQQEGNSKFSVVNGQVLSFVTVSHLITHFFSALLFYTTLEVFEALPWCPFIQIFFLYHPNLTILKRIRWVLSKLRMKLR